MTNSDFMTELRQSISASRCTQLFIKQCTFSGFHYPQSNPIEIISMPDHGCVKFKVS